MVGQNGQVGQPRAHGCAVLLRHHPHYLRDVPQVVHNPCGQQLRERNLTEARMLARQREVLRGEAPGPKELQVGVSQPLELLE